MGRKCLLMTSTGFCLGMGTTSASFQDGGSWCSAKLQLRMEVTGWAIKSAYSLNTQLGIPSGPAALQGFNFLIAVKTSTSEMVTTTEFALKGGIALSGKKDFIWSRKAELMAFATSQSGRWWSSPSTWSSECFHDSIFLSSKQTLRCRCVWRHINHDLIFNLFFAILLRRWKEIYRKRGEPRQIWSYRMFYV